MFKNIHEFFYLFRDAKPAAYVFVDQKEVVVRKRNKSHTEESFRNPITSIMGANPIIIAREVDPIIQTPLKGICVFGIGYGRAHFLDKGTETSYVTIHCSQTPSDVTGYF